MYLPIIVAMVLYPVLAIVFIIFVWKRTPKKLLRGLAIAIAILLPSWDAVFSAAFFYATRRRGGQVLNYQYWYERGNG